MTRYEYKTIYIPSTDFSRLENIGFTIRDVLREEGDDGWELVAVVRDQGGWGLTFFFKKEK